jgi:hypothetical protein
LSKHEAALIGGLFRFCCSLSGNPVAARECSLSGVMWTSVKDLAHNHKIIWRQSSPSAVQASLSMIVTQ